jgi:hypothetical protein
MLKLVFLVATSCELVGRYRGFGGTHFPLLQGSPEDGGSVLLEMLVSAWKYTLHYNQEDQLQQKRTYNFGRKTSRKQAIWKTKNEIEDKIKMNSEGK